MFTDSPGVAAYGHPRNEAAAGLALPPAFRIEPCEVNDPRRAEAETYIRDRFQHTHGAVIRTFMPTLLLLTRADEGTVPASAELDPTTRLLLPVWSG